MTRRKLRRLALAAVCGWLGWILTPIALANWTHGQEFAWMTASEVLSWVADIRSAIAVGIAISILYGINVLIVKDLTSLGVGGWSFLCGAYLSSLIYFNWFERLDTMPLPGPLNGGLGAAIEIVALLAVPSSMAMLVLILERRTFGLRSE